MPWLWCIVCVPEYGHTESELGYDDGNTSTKRNPRKYVRSTAAIALGTDTVSPIFDYPNRCLGTYQLSTPFLWRQNARPMVLSSGSWVYTRQLRQCYRTRTNQEQHDDGTVDQRYGPALSHGQGKSGGYTRPAVGDDPASRDRLDTGHIPCICGLETESNELGRNIFELAFVRRWIC